MADARRHEADDQRADVKQAIRLHAVSEVTWQLQPCSAPSTKAGRVVLYCSDVVKGLSQQTTFMRRVLSHLISDLLSSELLTHVSDGMNSSTKVVVEAISVSEEYGGRTKGMKRGDEEGKDGGGSDLIDKTLMQATRTPCSSPHPSNRGRWQQPGRGPAVLSKDPKQVRWEQRPVGRGRGSFGVAEWMQVYNTAERCARYTDRLGLYLSSGDRVLKQLG